MKSTSKDEIKSDLIKVQTLVGNVPTKAEYQKYGNFDMSIIRFHFGFWCNLKSEVFGKDQYFFPPKNKPILCQNCKRQTYNPKFCCQSCSTSFNNKSENGRKIGKTKTIKYCQSCQAIIKRGIKCKSCNQKLVGIDKNEYHFFEITKQLYITDDTQKYRRIRFNARTIAKQNGLLDKCKICNYSLHVECAHIKSIESFPNNSLVTEINHPNNLIGLCRNCHWEFDNGYLKLQAAPSPISILPLECMATQYKS